MLTAAELPELGYCPVRGWRLRTSNPGAQTSLGPLPPRVLESQGWASSQTHLLVRPPSVPTAANRERCALTGYGPTSHQWATPGGLKAPDPLHNWGRGGASWASWEPRLSQLHQYHADRLAKGTGGRRYPCKGSSPSSSPGCHFTRRMAVIWPPRTEGITTILCGFRSKRAFTAILLTAP